MSDKVGGDRSGHFLQASVALGSRAIKPWEPFDPVSLLEMMPKDTVLSSCRTVRICIRVLFLIVSEEAVQVSTGGVKQAASVPQGKGKVHAEIYRKLQTAGPNKASIVISSNICLNVWTQGASMSSAAECLLPLTLTCCFTTHLPRPPTESVDSHSSHFIEGKLRQ